MLNTGKVSSQVYVKLQYLIFIYSHPSEDSVHVWEGIKYYIFNIVGRGLKINIQRKL